MIQICILKIHPRGWQLKKLFSFFLCTVNVRYPNVQISDDLPLVQFEIIRISDDRFVNLAAFYIRLDRFRYKKKKYI